MTLLWCSGILGHLGPVNLPNMYTNNPFFGNLFICVLSALVRCVFTNAQKQFLLKLHEAVAKMKQKHEKTMFMLLNL